MGKPTSPDATHRTEAFSKSELVHFYRLFTEMKDELENRGVQIDAERFEEGQLTPLVDNRHSHEDTVKALAKDLGDAVEEFDETEDSPTLDTDEDDEIPVFTDSSNLTDSSN